MPVGSTSSPPLNSVSCRGLLRKGVLCNGAKKGPRLLTGGLWQTHELAYPESISEVNNQTAMTKRCQAACFSRPHGVVRN